MEDLRKAIYEDNLAKVNEILATGVDVNEFFVDPPVPPLYYLVLSGKDSAGIAKALLDNNANPDYVHPGDPKQNPVLILALMNKKYKIAEVLIEEGATPDVLNKDKQSPLFWATDTPGIVTGLIDAGADPNFRIYGRDVTVFMFCVLREKWTAIQAMLDECCDDYSTLDEVVNAVDNEGQNAAFYVTSRQGVSKVEEYGVYLDQRNKQGDTPLTATMHIDEDGATAMEFLRYEVDVNVVNNNGNTPLILATDIGILPVAKKLIEKGADVNYQHPSDGMTPLIIAASDDRVDFVKMLLEEGADKTAKNNDGKTAYDLTTKEEIKALLRGDSEPGSPWTGLNQSDVAIFDTFFAPGPADDPEANKINWSCCPVCLAYVYRSEACRYMSHDCSKQAGVILHKRLYDLYKKANKMIEWCTVCGRVCEGHHHYKLAPHEAATRAPMAPYNPGAVFYFGGEAECIQDGGGGLAEKVKRLDRLRTWAKELQSEVGKITEKEARMQLIEEAWNAPLSRAPTARILQEGKFTVPTTDFPQGPAPVVAPEGPAPDVPKPADEIANVPEIIGEGGFDVILQYDTAPVARFIHKKKDGTVYRHTDQELVSKEGLEAYIANQNTNFGLPNFGYCFAPGCDAKLWPQDVKDLIDDPAVYEDYRKKFNEKFRVLQGGAGKPLFVQATGVVCPKKSGRRRTHRPKRATKKTRRTNFVRKS